MRCHKSNNPINIVCTQIRQPKNELCTMVMQPKNYLCYEVRESLMGHLVLEYRQLPRDNMVFMKNIMIRNNGIYVVFLNAKKFGLNWLVEAAFASYTCFCQLTFFFRISNTFITLEIESALKKKKSHV